MSLCTKNCDNCFFRKSFSGGAVPYCDYYCMTGIRRPCAAGDCCTVKVTRRVYRKKERTPEEKAAFAEKQRERNRKKCNDYYHKNKDRINAKARERRMAKCAEPKPPKPRAIDRGNKKNIKCEHCKHCIGDRDSSICGNPCSEHCGKNRAYYHRCKAFEWRENNGKAD